MEPKAHNSAVGWHVGHTHTYFSFDGAVEPPIVKAHKHKSILLTLDALLVMLICWSKQVPFLFPLLFIIIIIMY